MIHKVQIEEYIARKAEMPTIDVRTPKEYEYAHIPGATNIPIFSDEERVVIGTTYKQVSKEEAVLKGFEFVGPNWRKFIEKGLEVAPRKQVFIHCWRGGMRSGAMAWAFDFYGFDVFLIDGGYKSYRKWVLNQFEKEYPFVILGGLTGSHKTEILQQMRKEGEQIIDLEALANHQGSAFGSKGYKIQPQQEAFENQLAHVLDSMDTNRRIWLEDESNMIGKSQIPNSIFKQLRQSELIELQIPSEKRLAFLAEEYGSLNPQFLIDSTEKIKKKIGFDRAKQAIEHIQKNEIKEFIQIVLYYYDKAYKCGIDDRKSNKIHVIESEFIDANTTGKEIIDYLQKELI